MNRQRGSLTGYDCPECLNRGFSYVLRDTEIVQRQCRCKEIRDSARRIQNSGLGGLIEECAFDKFIVTEPWQGRMKEIAMQFTADYTGKWLYIGGQVGAGKTFICTAVTKCLMDKGKAARYMLWRDEVVKLKACVNNDEEYNRLISPLKSVDVLYIDDLFKTAAGKRPTDADVNIAFEILNFRYINSNLVTIMSGERTMEELLDVDEAVGSRIYQRTKEYCLIIPKNQKNNFRLRQ